MMKYEKGRKEIRCYKINVGHERRLKEVTAANPKLRLIMNLFNLPCDNKEAIKNLLK